MFTKRKDEKGSAFWVETMRHNAAKREGMRAHACALSMSLPRAFAEGGRLLERDEGNNYALALVTEPILNQVFIAETRGDDRYEKYFPHSKKTGAVKKINFKSEHFCQTEITDHVPVMETTKSFARSKIRACGKAWSCPICAAKIAVRRNAEVHKIIDKAHAEGMTTYMLTLTAPHYYGQRLLDVASRMQNAYAHFDNSRATKKLKKEYAVFGRIKTMETMIGGKNGWHNHFHIVLIFNRKIDGFDEARILETILQQWERSCFRSGLLDFSNEKQLAAFREHAVSLKKDFDPDYIAKQSEEWKREHGASEQWGAAEELTFSHIKKGDGSCTAFGFVARAARLAAAGLLSAAELASCVELFIEYCCAMHGRSMIQFSKGLRAWAGLDEDKTDQDICDEDQDNEVEMIGGFDKDQHTFVRKNALWRPFKKLLEQDKELAIKTINEIFAAHGFHDFYTAQEMEGFVFGFDSSFDIDAPTVAPPKLEADEKAKGEVCPKTSAPKFEQLKLFAA